MPFFKLKDLKEPDNNKVKVKQKTIKKMIIKLCYRFRDFPHADLTSQGNQSVTVKAK